MRAWKRTYLHADMHTRRHPGHAHTRKQTTEKKDIHMFTYIYIYIYVDIHIYISRYLRICIHRSIHIRIGRCGCACMFPCLHFSTRVYVI